MTIVINRLHSGDLCLQQCYSLQLYIFNSLIWLTGLAEVVLPFFTFYLDAGMP